MLYKLITSPADIRWMLRPQHKEIGDIDTLSLPAHENSNGNSALAPWLQHGERKTLLLQKAYGDF